METPEQPVEKPDPPEEDPAQPAPERDPGPPPEPPAGLRKSRSLEHCHPELARRARAFEADFERTTKRQIFRTCTYRSRAEQMELYEKGRRGVPGERPVTWVDGVSKISDHNRWPARAIDYAVDLDPGPAVKVTWDEPEYEAIGEIARRNGLDWGGDWSGEKRDMPHVALPDDVV